MCEDKTVQVEKFALKCSRVCCMLTWSWRPFCHATAPTGVMECCRRSWSCICVVSIGGARDRGASSGRVDFQDARGARHDCRLERDVVRVTRLLAFVAVHKEHPCPFFSCNIIRILGLAVEEEVLSMAVTELIGLQAGSWRGALRALSY